MPDNIRYNQLNRERKRFQNIIRMICYQLLLRTYFPLIKKIYKRKAGSNQKIINTPNDMRPEYEKNKLFVTLYTLPTPRENQALQKILKTLNDSKKISWY